MALTGRSVSGVVIMLNMRLDIGMERGLGTIATIGASRLNALIIRMVGV